MDKPYNIVEDWRLMYFNCRGRFDDHDGVWTPGIDTIRSWPDGCGRHEHLNSRKGSSAPREMRKFKATSTIR